MWAIVASLLMDDLSLEKDPTMKMGRPKSLFINKEYLHFISLNRPRAYTIIHRKYQFKNDIKATLIIQVYHTYTTSNSKKKGTSNKVRR